MAAVTSAQGLHLAAAGALSPLPGEGAQEAAAGKMTQVWDETPAISGPPIRDRRDGSRKRDDHRTAAPAPATSSEEEGGEGDTGR